MAAEAAVYWGVPVDVEAGVTEDPAQVEQGLDAKRLEFERYKAYLDYRKAIIISGYVALAVAALPPLFQLATAGLEFAKSWRQLRIDEENKKYDRATKDEEYRDQYVRDFLGQALNQDIELRIRLAEYFKFVASGDARKGWEDYHTALTETRTSIRNQIEAGETQLAELQKKPPESRDRVEEGRLIQRLDWAYKEVAYVPRNRSVTSNPRDLALAARPSENLSITLAKIPEERRAIAEKVINAFAAAGFGVVQQAAALANAIGETNLDPNARETTSQESAFGLFLLNQRGGLGAGFSTEQLLDPDVNIGIMLSATRRIAQFVSAMSLPDAVEVFVRQIERPANPEREVARRLAIAQTLVQP